MKISVIKKQNTVVSQWAGGESVQYYIYPKNSSYANRNFLFRISLAVSNMDEEADYSDLTGYKRHLIMLDGTARVHHEAHYDIVMNPYKEIDMFDGAWKSSAKGQVTDFNLMVSNMCAGEISVIDESCTFAYDTEQNEHDNFLAFFCGDGNADMIFNTGEQISIVKGDLLIIKNPKRNIKIEILTEKSKLIKMIVKC